MSMHSELQSIDEGENDQEEESESPKGAIEVEIQSDHIKSDFKIKVQVTKQPSFEKSPIVVNPI